MISLPLKRRHWLLNILGLTTFVPSSNTLAQPSSALKPGVDYIVLPQSPGINNGGSSANKSIELVNFFWYGCPHCHAFEPILAEWLKKLPAKVNVVFTPVIFRPDFVTHQKLYYALEAIDKVTSHHKKVFSAIHTHNEKLNTDALIFNWIKKQSDIDYDKFFEAYKSFSVATKIHQAKLLQDKYQVAGVPTLGIDRKYYIDGNSAGNMTRGLSIANELLLQRA